MLLCLYVLLLNLIGLQHQLATFFHEVLNRVPYVNSFGAIQLSSFGITWANEHSQLCLLELEIVLEFFTIPLLFVKWGAVVSI